MTRDGACGSATREEKSFGSGMSDFICNRWPFTHLSSGTQFPIPNPGEQLGQAHRECHFSASHQMRKGLQSPFANVSPASAPFSCPCISIGSQRVQPDKFGKSSGHDPKIFLATNMTCHSKDPQWCLTATAHIEHLEARLQYMQDLAGATLLKLLDLQLPAGLALL